jgi:two-component system phosphate regulon response regulator PhoB
MEGGVLTRTRIYETVWGVNFTGSSRTIDVHVDQVRKKLGKFSEWLTTLRGIGYRFEMTE